MRNKIVLSFVVIGLLQGSVGAASNWSFYNRNDIGAKALGMGGAFISVADDPTAVYWNPAGLTQIDKLTVLATGEFSKGEVYFTWEWDTIPELFYETSHYFYSLINVVLPTEKVTWCISEYIPYDFYAICKGLEEYVENECLRKFDVIDYRRFYTTTVSMAYKMNPYLSMGINLNYFLKRYGIVNIYEDGEEHTYLIESGHGFGGDIGILYKPHKNLGVGLVTKYNFLPIGGIIGGTKVEETLPLFVGIGISARASPKILLNADINFTKWNGISFKWGGELDNPENVQDMLQQRIGVEYFVKENIALRIGLYNEPSLFTTGADRGQVFLTCGIGVKHKHFEFNTALASSRLINPKEKKETNLILSLTYR
ncbi:hypothetical protein KAW65_06550 [candidate division WOR-3 bacterium]|nr:hypothetical protein [candidate division WOR-3 bacterium]